MVDNPRPTPTPTPTATPGPSATPTLEPTHSPIPLSLSLLVTVGGNGSPAFSEGSKDKAQFYDPSGIALMDDGSLLVADQGNHRIRKVSPAGEVSTFAGSGTKGYLNGAADVAQFNSPTGVAVGTDGTVYVADKDNQRIRRVSPSGEVSTLAGTGAVGTSDGVGTGAKFSYPYAVTVDAGGTVYVADTGNSLIRKITPQGHVSTLAGSAGPGYADGQALGEARFQMPTGVAVTANGTVLVADRSNHRLRRVSPDGTVSTLAGGESGFLDGETSNARFKYPHSVVIGPDDYLYVTDEQNHRIRRLKQDGTVSTIAGNGKNGMAVGNGYSPQDALNTAFSFPAGIAVSASGTVFISDRANHAIRKLY